MPQSGSEVFLVLAAFSCLLQCYLFFVAKGVLKNKLIPPFLKLPSMWLRIVNRSLFSLSFFFLQTKPLQFFKFFLTGDIFYTLDPSHCFTLDFIQIVIYFWKSSVQIRTQVPSCGLNTAVMCLADDRPSQISPCDIYLLHNRMTLLTCVQCVIYYNCQDLSYRITICFGFVQPRFIPCDYSHILTKPNCSC